MRIYYGYLTYNQLVLVALSRGIGERKLTLHHTGL